MAAAQGPGSDAPGDSGSVTGRTPGWRSSVWAWIVGMILLGFAVWGIARIANGINHPAGTSLSSTQTGSGHASAGGSASAGGAGTP